MSATDLVIRRKEQGWYGWQVVVATVVASALSPATLVNVPFSLFVPQLQNAFAWSRPQIAAALSILLVLLVVALPIAGYLVDRFGARRVTIPSIAAYGLALASLYFLTPSTTHFYAVYGAIAILGAGAQSPSYIRVISAWFDQRRGLIIGICMAGFGAGYILVPMLVHATITTLGWRSAYAVLGALVIAVPLPVIALLLRDAPPGEASATGSSDNRVGAPGIGLMSAMGTREFWLLATTFVLMSFSLSGVQSQLVSLLQDRGMRPATAALMLSVVGVGSLPGRLLVGFTIDRVFAPWVALACYGAAALALLWLVNGQAPLGVLLCALAIGVSLGAENDILGFLVGRYFGLKRFGQIYGVLLGSYLLGAAGGAYFMAWVYAASGSYRRGLLIDVAAIVLACCLLLGLRRYDTGRGSTK
ncbi:MAG: MFS transporter [Proteobacteria bacterium]|nr:MFS transporter [Pseudomonadota bacterium]